MRKPPATRRVSPEAVVEIRAAFDARQAIPTDAALVERHGIARGTVRAIGRRMLYRDVPEVSTKE